MTKFFKLSAFFYIFLILVAFPSPIQAQEASASAKKNVVKNFKVDLNNLIPVGSADSCSLKARGDANCDGRINLFDLSVWQVEFNALNSPKRSDFNGDGLVNLADFGVWRTTFYPQRTSAATSWLSKVASWFNFPVDAQESQPVTGGVASSQTLSSASGNNHVVNTTTNGNIQQVSFDPNGNMTSAQLFDAKGHGVSGVSFLQTGATIVTTSQNGIPVQIYKTAEGPVVEYFNNPNGSLIAIKTWPNQSSLDKNDPPLAVSIPTQNNNLLTLSITPNTSSIIAQTDPQGNLLSQAQSRSDGTYLSTDLQNQTTTESNSQVGLSTIEMANNLGGKTTYHFYKSGLFAIVQTDKANNYYIAQTIDAMGSNWSFKSTVNGQVSDTTTTDPIAKTGGNTPSAQKIVNDINYYKSLPVNPELVNFQDAFGTSGDILPAQLTQANQFLTAQIASPPSQVTSWLLKFPEAFADSGTSGTGAALASSGNITSTAQTGIGTDTSNVTVSEGGSQTTTVSNSSGSVVASSTTNNQGDNTVSDGSTTTRVNSVAKQISLGISFTPTFGTTPIPVHREENTYHSEDSCFLAGTKISTPNGEIAIEKLTPGMKVYSFNEKTHQKEIADFFGLDINFVDEYLIINNRINVTTYHPFYVSDPITGSLSLVKADKLKVGDLLVNESGIQLPIVSIERIKQKETVYNLKTVTPNNNFYAEGILVHNYNDDHTSNQSNGDTTGNDNGGW